ncbi:MAG: major capsid protein [Pontimonas sp.]
MGDEDVHLHSTDFVSVKPFRQVYKKVTPYSVATVNLDVGTTTPITYGQTLRFTIPRKGDLLVGLTVRMHVKRTSALGHFPAEELIDRASLVMGKQVIDDITGEWIRIQNAILDTPDQRDARYRMSDFEITDGQGATKTLYVDIPFFFTQPSCCLPLVALQYVQPEVVITFKASADSLDPAIQPEISVTGEYVYLDDTEREWWAKQSHDLLIPFIQTTEDRVDIDETRLSRLYTEVPVAFGTPASITGAAASVPESTVVDLSSDPQRVVLVDYPSYAGQSTILYDAGDNATTFSIAASLLIPSDGWSSAVWARRVGDLGYEVRFSINGSDINVDVYRNGSRIVYLRSDEVFSAALTSVTGDDTSYAIVEEIAAGEVWVAIDITHNVEDFSVMLVNYTIEGYTVGGKLAGETAVSTKTKFFRVSEGYSAVRTIGIATQMGFSAQSAAYQGIVTDIVMTTRQVQIAPVDENLTNRKTKIYNRGPVRYIAWTTTPLDPAASWAAFSTGEKGTYSTRYDPLHSAQVLINGKPRTDMEDSTFYTVVHPCRTIQRALPAGVHMYSFCNNPTSMHPDATMNFSRAGDIVLFQRYRKWNGDATTLADLLPSESLPIASTYKRIRIYVVGFNVLLVENGTALLRYV